VSKDGKELKYLDELKLSNEEDAPMTLAVSRPVRAARRGGIVSRGSQADE
jgi:hypothetical protein